MPFPPTPRSIYRHNPLEFVVCQIRFPSILRIETELPARFQEAVRDRLEVFEEPGSAPLGLQLSDELAQLIASPGFLGPRTRKSYRFTASDGSARCVLARDFISFEVKKYSRWEDFWDWFARPLTALVDLYRPSHCTRIGLRYRNVIQRSRLGLSNEPWSLLLRSEVAAELGASDLRGEVLHAARELLIRLADDAGSVRVRHGLDDSDSPEKAYVIDSDFFCEAPKMEMNDAKAILDGFHTRAGHLFRWCISERLHEAMEPDLAQ